MKIYARHCASIFLICGLALYALCDESDKIKFFRMAAEQGSVDAQINLAVYYITGEGVETDIEKATYWFMKAAEQGDAMAQHNLALNYEDGKGIEKDFIEAFKWMRKSAEQRYPPSLYSLARMYENGIGCKKDRVKAEELYKIAFDALNKCSAKELEDKYLYFFLAKMYYDGKGVTKDLTKAFELYGKSAELGDCAALCNLGEMYLKGESVEKDYNKALELFNQALECNELLPVRCAKYNLGKMYLKGEGVERNYEKAFVFLSESAEQGEAEAQFNLGVMYANGLGVAKDESKAAMWLQKSAESGNADAQYNLGVMYANGLGVAKDVSKAVEWYRKSAEQGEVKAQFNLGVLHTVHKKSVLDLNLSMTSIPGKNYLMSKYEVTQQLWSDVMGYNPSYFTGDFNRPVECVSWNTCQRFLEKLNSLPEVKASGLKYRFPTQEEWEYACRAGATGAYCKLADGTEITDDTLNTVSYFLVNSSSKTHPIGNKDCNAFGLYDMIGNVSEWTVTSDGVCRIYCGGSWNSVAVDCMVGSKAKGNPNYRNITVGLRLCASKIAK